MKQNMTLKKYANRRLYDTESSRYVTLEEVAEAIRAGGDLRVLDATTGADLTQATLAQIIVESRDAGRLLPVPLLVQLIRLSDDTLADFLGRFLTTALELYLQARQGAHLLSPYNPFATMPFQATNALASMLGRAAAGWGDLAGQVGNAAPQHSAWGQGAPASMSPQAEAGWAAEPPNPRSHGPQTPPAPPPPPSPAPSPSDDLSDLRRELAELRASLASATTGPSKPRRSASKPRKAK